VKERSKASERGERVVSWPTAALLALSIAALVTASCSTEESAFVRSTQARHAAATLQTVFAHAVEAASRAVMADTEPRSAQLVTEARRAREQVMQAYDELAKLLRAADFAPELKLLEEFRAKFAAYEALDRDIMGLAGENTNLKATQLAFGPARESADTLAAALDRTIAAGPSAQASQVRVLALEVLVAVRTIQSLQAPHIAESNDAIMTAMEATMGQAQAEAQQALDTLSKLLPPESTASSITSLGRFLSANAEVVALSRRNTNLRTLELTLGHKRTVVATCQDSLRALSESLDKRVARPRRSP
jgi:hypothetical protein